MKNIIPKGFLKKYKISDNEEVIYISLGVGYLRLEYNAETSPFLLSRVSFVASPNLYSKAIEEQLEFNLSKDGSYDEATFISEMGVSGIQWADGQVRWGHTYDEDDTITEEGRKIALDLWVDECIEIMINPSQDVLNKLKEGYDLKASFELIKSGDEKASEDFWSRCNPTSSDEVKLALEILQYAIDQNDSNAIFTCCDPLKRACTDQILILETITLLLENNIVTNNFDRLELQEILEAHASFVHKELEERWLKLCKESYKINGLEFIQVIHEGHLVNALAKVRTKNESLLDFFKDIVKRVESQSKNKESFTCYISYQLMLKALGINNLSE